MPELSRSDLISSRKTAHASDAIDWMKDTVLHPLVNAAIVEPCNTITHAATDVTGKHLNFGELKPLQSKKAEPYSTDWFVQSAASGVGSMLPFIISGKIAGATLRGTAAQFELKGTTAAILNSEKTALLAGAGAYAAMKRPLEGETRLGNAMGTVAAFAVFEGGNSLANLPQFKQSITARTALRLGSGFIGGATQVELSSLVSQQKHAKSEHLLQSAVAGASLNVSMGFLQDKLSSRVKEPVEVSARTSTNLQQRTDGAHLPGQSAETLQQRSDAARTPGQSSETLQQRSDAARTPGQSSETLQQRTDAARLPGQRTGANDAPIPIQGTDKGVLGRNVEPISLVRSDNPAAKVNVAEPSARKGDVVYIVVDSGFSPDSLPPKQNILGTWDPTGEGVFNDPLNHGSTILAKLRDADPSAKFMLIKAYDGGNNLAQTRFENGQIAKAGWTEAYLEAVALAKRHKLPSVANCSFGEFTHAMDGTGWESYQLGQVIGKGKEGHVVVAATGPGTGIARHASGMVEAGRSGEVNISQNGEAAFNLWMGKDSPRDWQLSVYEGGRVIHTVDGAQLAPNFWNNRQQITFRSWIENAASRFVLSRTGSDPRPLKFDYFVQEGKATFMDHVNPELVSEPAVFPQVVAVGIQKMSYSPTQTSLGSKPNILLPGEGPVSFRTPEVTYAIGQMLKSNPKLDATQVQKLVGKYPQGQ